MYSNLGIKTIKQVKIKKIKEKNEKKKNKFIPDTNTNENHVKTINIDCPISG